MSLSSRLGNLGGYDPEDIEEELAIAKAKLDAKLDLRTRAKASVLEHLTTLFGPVDSMLRSHPTQTTLVPTVGADTLAQAHGDTIAFSRAAIFDLAAADADNDDIRGLGIRLAAANYRSVAAADLNVYSDMAPFRHLRNWSDNHARAFISAEVGRLETQYSGLYPSLRTIFQYDLSCILGGILRPAQSERVAQTQGPKQVLAAFSIVAMRPYLDLTLFNQLYEAAVEAGIDEGVLDEVTRIGEEFVTLRWPEDAETGRRLSERLAELVEFPESATSPVEQCGMRGESSKRDDGEMKDQGAQAGKDAADESNSPQESPDNGAQSGQGDKDGDQEGDGDSEGQENDQNGQGKSALDQVRDRLNQLGQAARNSSEGNKVDKMTEDAAEAAGVGLDAAEFTHEMQPVSMTAQALRGQLTKVFMELIEQTAGGVSYGTKRGKLVPIDRRMGKRRYRSTVTSNRRNELSIDVAVLIDVSGSLVGHGVKLGEAVWAIKGGIDDVATRARGLAQARVWSYNYDSKLFMAEMRRTNPTMMAVPTTSGGTSPVKSLKEARQWLVDSKASNKMLVMLTDGQWDGGTEAERLIGEINHLKGATSVLFGMGGAVQHYGNHGCQHGLDIKDLSLMASTTRTIIRNSLKARVG